VELTEPITKPIIPGQPSDLSHPTPNDPPWNSWIALALWFVSVLLIVFAPAVLLLPYLATSGVLSGPQEEIARYASTDPTAIVIQMIAIIPAHLFTLVFAWLVVTKRGRFSFRETLGFRSGGMRWWHYVLIFVSFFGLAAAVGSYFPENDNELLRILRSSRTAVFVVAFMATFTAPLIEEVIYRGVLFSAFQRSVGVAAAVIFVTLIFALVHVPQYYESPSTLALLLILSLVLTLMRVYSQNLLPCIIFHTIVNGFQSAALIAEPYLRQAAVMEDIARSFLGT
jgi:membrane protease YdiL (CAAX protease family)